MTRTSFAFCGASATLATLLAGWCYSGWFNQGTPRNQSNLVLDEKWPTSIHIQSDPVIVTESNQYIQTAVHIFNPLSVKQTIRVLGRSCGCLTVADSIIIGPNESKELPFSSHTTMITAHRSLMIQPGDGLSDIPRTTANWSADIFACLSAPYVGILQLENASDANPTIEFQLISVRQRGEPEIRPSISSLHLELTATITEDSDAPVRNFFETRWRCPLTLNPAHGDKSAQMHPRETVAMSITDGVATITLPVVINHRPALIDNPPTVLLRVNGSGPSIRDVTVKVHPSIHTAVATSESNAVRVVTQQLNQNNSTFKLRLQAEPAGLPDGVSRGAVRIILNDNHRRPVAVPVLIWVEPSKGEGQPS